MKPGTVMIVDDDAEIRELVAMYLRDHDFEIVEAASGDMALRQFLASPPDLIILDIRMPGMDGFTFGKRIREKSSVPIIFLSSKSESEDIVKGLEFGGADYVTKPFMPDVLIARVKLLLQRAGVNLQPELMQFGDLTVHRSTREVSFRGLHIPFLAKEIKLFMFLAEHPRQVFSAEQLYEQVWDFADGDARTVMVHISNIRKKLEVYAPDSVNIETIKGMGYRLVSMEHMPKKPHSLSTREAIIEAAAMLFADRGYEGMTIKEVAKQVGIHTSSIYAYFKNKEDLFLHIYRSVLSGHLQLAVSNAAEPATRTTRGQFDELLHSVIQYQLKEASKMKIYIRILLFPAGYFEQDMKAELIKLENMEHELFADMFKKGMENGEIRGEDENSLALLLICMMDGFFWEMQRHEGDVFLGRFEQVWEQFWRLIQV